MLNDRIKKKVLLDGLPKGLQGCSYTNYLSLSLLAMGYSDTTTHHV